MEDRIKRLEETLNILIAPGISQTCLDAEFIGRADRARNILNKPCQQTTFTKSQLIAAIEKWEKQPPWDRDDLKMFLLNELSL